MNTRFPLNLDCGKSVAFNLTEEQVETLLGHEDVARHIVAIGLKNILQDSHASVTRDGFATDDEWVQAKRDRASLKLGDMMAGLLRAQRAARPKVDDFTNVARKLVLSLMSKEQKAKISTEVDGKMQVDVEKVDAIFAKNEAKLRPQVEAKLEEMRKAAELADSIEIEI